jgi:hypothetical protein
MTKRYFALSLAASSMIVVAVIWLWSAEVVELVATGEVELVAKKHATRSDAPVVAVLHAGQRSRIYGCDPRKSDIDIELRVGERTVVARGSQFIIERRPASLNERLTEPWVTTSCVGLLGG